MRKLALATLIALACGCEAKTERVPRDSRWERVFFQTIDEKARACGLAPLRDTVIPEDSAEIRIWAGFGLQGFPPGGHPLEGIVLRKTGDRFSGVHYPRAPSSATASPRSGWPAFWGKLESAGAFDLPDSTELKDYNRGIRDGVSYVVETRRHDRYRTYMYGNPALQELPEAKRFLRLLELVRTETGFDSGQ